VNTRLRAGRVLVAAADQLKAEAMTFPPREDEAGTWAEGELVVNGERVFVFVRVDPIKSE
jgi:hypothetical protein